MCVFKGKGKYLKNFLGKVKALIYAARSHEFTKAPINAIKLKRDEDP